MSFYERIQLFHYQPDHDLEYFPLFKEFAPWPWQPLPCLFWHGCQWPHERCQQRPGGGGGGLQGELLFAWAGPEGPEDRASESQASGLGWASLLSAESARVLARLRTAFLPPFPAWPRQRGREGAAGGMGYGDVAWS